MYDMLCNLQIYFLPRGGEAKCQGTRLYIERRYYCIKMHTLRVTKTKIYFFLFFLTFAFFITTLFLHAFSIFYMVHNNHLHP